MKKIHIILISAISLFVFGCLGVIYNSYSNKPRKIYPIKSIVQKTKSVEKLKTKIFLDLLDLTTEKMTDLNKFDLKKAEEKLRSFPLIDQVKIAKVYPETLSIEYVLKEPMFFVADFKNVAIDEKGYLFPIEPYLAPKKLPKVVLGITFDSWEKKVESKEFDLVSDLLFLLKGRPEIVVKKIDASNALSKDYGKREIVLTIEERLFNGHHVFYFPFVLRLNPNHFDKQLANFLALRKEMLKDYESQIQTLTESKRFEEKIIDLRIENLALIQK